MSLPLLPGHIDEFFLISDHVLLVEIVDLDELDVLVPSVHHFALRARFVPSQDHPHVDSKCFEAMTACYSE